MSDSGGEKHQFGGLIARIIGPMPKMRAAARERAGAALDGLADGLGRHMG